MGKAGICQVAEPCRSVTAAFRLLPNSGAELLYVFLPSIASAGRLPGMNMAGSRSQLQGIREPGPVQAHSIYPVAPGLSWLAEQQEPANHQYHPME